MAIGNQFRSLFYRSSILSGDILSVNVLEKQLRPIRSMGLQYARLYADVKSVSGQGVGLRVQRRLAGRVTGRVGQAFIPQTLGIPTRIANRYFGRIATMKVQNYFNKKQRSNYTYKQNGAVLTAGVKKAINRQSGGRVEQELQRARKKWGQMGLDLNEFSLPELMSDIQYNMLGVHSVGGGKAAPKRTGNLHDSIIFRGIFASRNGIARGNITIGASKGNKTKMADQAPYWWKTNYGGYYYWNPGTFIPARKYGWVGYSIYGALRHYFPNQDTFEVVVNRKKNTQASRYLDFQPPPPPDGAYEIGIYNHVDLGNEFDVGSRSDVPF
tara:strand:- start:11820 stop:12797 length:978 start_codon:yes stop_codon:yes gene_type:complete